MNRIIINTKQGNTRELGISNIIIYIMLCIYIILSNYYNKHIGFSLINHKKSLMLNDLLYNSDNIGTIFLIILWAILTIWLLLIQKFYKSTNGIITIISYIISILILIISSKYKNYIIIFFLYTSFSIFSILTIETYKDKFNANTLNELYICSYTMIIINIILFILLLLSYSLKKKKIIYKYLFSDIMGLLNILYIGTLIIFIYYISIYPTIDSTPINSIIVTKMIS